MVGLTKNIILVNFNFKFYQTIFILASVVGILGLIPFSLMVLCFHFKLICMVLCFFSPTGKEGDDVSTAGLGPGALAGIIIVILAIIVFAVIGTIFYLKKRQGKKNLPTNLRF